ncbi:MAG: hypothetical protein NC924_05765 [Candidatus Omnitrophica bacterium]|nr:hypothetical protein [Candidatus Omnitrophota bacterium]
MMIQTMVLAISLFIFGFVLLLFELLIVPGFGLIGILGILSVAAACYTVFTSLNTVAGVLITLLSALLVHLLIRRLPKTGIWKKIRLSAVERAGAGFSREEQDFKQLLGQDGVAHTMLRPGGTVIIRNRRYDAITEGIYIDKDAKIQVCNISGTTLVVKKING